MTTTAIAVINGQQIQVTNDEAQMVPIKPICQALGIADEPQVAKIKEHPILGSTTTLRVAVAPDVKQREMFCIPLKYVYGWLFTINPNNVNEDARENLILYQQECYDALYSYYTGKFEKERELDRREKELLQERDNVRQSIMEAKDKISQLKEEYNKVELTLSALRYDRHSPQMTLF